jgi:murein DD-endopeptidase MepM/ murein hydrolase activator NlpD
VSSSGVRAGADVFPMVVRGGDGPLSPWHHVRMRTDDATRKLSVAELFGLGPVRQTLAQAKLVFAGASGVPKSRFDVSSLHIFTPRLSVDTWRGKRVRGREIPILNLYNRTQTPTDDGWSVRVTQVRDFRGKKLTYDSHNGTDFVIPPGTVVVSAAPGRVVAIRREWNRGGLKLYIDHGEGVVTASNHLGRVLVDVGDRVGRATPVALSAYSGADGFFTFPWVAPHVHFNVFLNGVLVDPFAEEGEVSLWNAHNAPSPEPTRDDDARVPDTVFDAALVDRLLHDLTDDVRRDELARIADVTLRGFMLMIESTVYPTLFSTRGAGAMLYPEPHARAPRLALPFSRVDFDGIVFADDVGLRR